MTTQHQPLAPGTLLLVRFGTRAQRRLGAPGQTYLSRQATNLPAGQTLELVEDYTTGYGRVLDPASGRVYEVHMSDLMPKPTDQQVAHGSVDLQRTKGELEDVTGALRQAEAEVAALKAENAALKLRLTEAQVRLQALLDALGKPLPQR